MLVPDAANGGRWPKLKVALVPALLFVGALVGLWLLVGDADETRGAANRTKEPKRRARKKPRVFTSFAVEDEAARNLFVGQSKHEDTPFDLADFSLHRPFDNAWKTQTRPRIKGSDVVAVLIGQGTHAADGVLWEIKTAVEEGVPVFGVYIDRDKKGRKPSPLLGIPVINWTWDGIARQIRKAMKKSAGSR